MVIFEKEIMLGPVYMGTLMATTESERDGVESKYHVSLNSGKVVSVTSTEDKQPHAAFLTILKGFVENSKVPEDLDTIYLYIIKS